MTRIAFLGTPLAAVPTLEILADAHEIGLVVTQPDRPRGRSSSPAPPPIKEAAEARALPLAQPESGAELNDALNEHGPYDVGVVVAYGRILRSEILDIPDRGFLNLHFSLLPRWRGAAPVERALMAGDEMSGVTIIRLDEGLDTGPVLTAQAIDVRVDETAGSLTERLANMGARLLADVLADYVDGHVEPVRQSSDGVTYADKITAADRRLETAGSVSSFINQVRGLAPEPGATLEIDGDRHKILAVAPHPASPPQGSWEAHSDIPVVGLPDGGVALVELQPPGKTRQRGEDWLRGKRRSGGTTGSGHTLE